MTLPSASYLSSKRCKSRDAMSNAKNSIGTSKLSSMFATRSFWTQLVPDLPIRDDCNFDDGEPWELPLFPC